MKQFFKAIFTHLFALALFFGGLFVLGLMFLAALAAGGGGGPRPVAIEDRTVLVLDLTMNLTDSPPPVDTGKLLELLGDTDRTLPLRRAAQALRAARDDSRIVALYIHGNLGTADLAGGLAAVRELREAVLDFKKSGKKVVGYIDAASGRDYYVLSTADSLTLNPWGYLGLQGVTQGGFFLKGFFEKYGVGMQVIRVGKYKSAIEPYTRSSFSPEEREQADLLLGVLWTEMKQAIADDRGISPEDVQAAADAGEGLDPDLALGRKLVTRLGQEWDVLKELRELAGKDPLAKSLPHVSLADYAAAVLNTPGPEAGGGGSGPAVAVVYAEGVIVDGEGEPGDLASRRFTRMVREVGRDKDVKAVVLRVNSPGGSVSASEAIRAALNELRERGTPVVVSMGSYAASGGYWISTASDRIFVQPTTVTGSIGVYGLVPNIGKLAADHGVTFDVVETAETGDLFTLSRPRTDAEMRLLQRTVDRVYEQFVDRVAEARKLPLDRVKEVAEGRVWSGADAVRLGLADEIGGLDEAIAAAAKAASVGSGYRVVEYPRTRSFEEFLKEILEGGPVRELAGARRDPVSRITHRIETELGQLRTLNDPRHVYARLPFGWEIE